jgi:hypothetical protein
MSGHVQSIKNTAVGAGWGTAEVDNGVQVSSNIGFLERSPRLRTRASLPRPCIKKGSRQKMIIEESVNTCCQDRRQYMLLWKMERTYLLARRAWG